MPSEKDILKKIRENADAWDEKPGDAAWSRLEQLLDEPPAEPGGGKVLKFRPIYGIVLLALLGSLLIWRPWSRQNVSDGASSEKLFSHPETTTHNTVSEIDKNNPNVESRPSVDSEGTNDRINNENSVVWDEGKIENGIDDPSDVTPDLGEVRPVNPDFSSRSGNEVHYPTRAERIEDLGSRPYNPNVEYYQTMSFPTGDSAEGLSETELNAYNSIFSNGNWGNNIAPSISNTGNFLAYSPSMNYNWNPAQTQNISDFNFLLGSWRFMGPSGAAFEKWEKKDRYTFVGKAYFVVNGDTIVTEQMQIREMDDGLYYIVAIDTLRKPRKFKLTSVGPSGALFENPEVDFPRQIIYQPGLNGGLNTIKRNEDQLFSVPDNEYGNSSDMNLNPVYRNMSKTDDKPK